MPIPDFLYHGTSVDAAVNIQCEGFDVDRSGSNAGAMLGPGVYCTTSLQKALYYVHGEGGGVVCQDVVGGNFGANRPVEAELRLAP